MYNALAAPGMDAEPGEWDNVFIAGRRRGAGAGSGDAGGSGDDTGGEAEAQAPGGPSAVPKGWSPVQSNRGGAVQADPGLKAPPGFKV